MPIEKLETYMTDEEARVHEENYNAMGEKAIDLILSQLRDIAVRGGIRPTHFSTLVSLGFIAANLLDSPLYPPAARERWNRRFEKAD